MYLFQKLEEQYHLVTDKMKKILTSCSQYLQSLKR